MCRFNNIISEILKKDWWEYLHQIILKGSVGIPRSKILKEKHVKEIS